MLNNNEVNKEESTYTNPIEETLLFQSMREGLGSGKQLFYAGIVDSLKPLLSLPFAKNWALYLCKNEERAKEVLQDCRAFSENIYFYPPKDYLFYKADTRGHYILRERGECLRHLLDHLSGFDGENGREKCFPGFSLYRASRDEHRAFRLTGKALGDGIPEGRADRDARGIFSSRRHCGCFLQSNGRPGPY